MKLSALDEILNGTISDFTGFPVSIPLKTRLKVSKAHDALWASLSQEQRTLFDNYCMEDANVLANYTDTFFKRGFRLGLMLAVEALYSEFSVTEKITKESFTEADMFDPYEKNDDRTAETQNNLSN